MIKQTLIGVLAVGYVGYFVEDQVPRSNVLPEPTTTAMTMDSPDSSVKVKAATFSRTLRDYQVSAKTGTLDSEQMVMYRDRIRTSFEAAFAAIEEREQEGDLADTEEARMTMQFAIDEYMSGPSTEKSVPITRDLEAYSRFLTETLIARSFATDVAD